MKIMIDEKGAKLAEELSEIAAVEDGTLQIGKNLEVDGHLAVNGDSDILNLYSFSTIIDKTEAYPHKISLPKFSLVKSIKVEIENPTGQFTEAITLIPIYFNNALGGFIQIYETDGSLKYIHPNEYLQIQSAPSISIDDLKCGGNTENYIIILDEDALFNLKVSITYQVGNTIIYTN